MPSENLASCPTAKKSSYSLWNWENVTHRVSVSDMVERPKTTSHSLNRDFAQEWLAVFVVQRRGKMMSAINSPLTRIRAHREAAQAEAYRREAAAEKSAQEAEFNHRANPRRRDDDELMAMCGIGSPRFSAPPSRR